MFVHYWSFNWTTCPLLLTHLALLLGSVSLTDIQYRCVSYSTGTPYSTQVSLTDIQYRCVSYSTGVSYSTQVSLTDLQYRYVSYSIYIYIYIYIL